MQTLRGLRAQIFFWTILPLILVLVVVSFGSITLHQRSMRDMVARRDAQLIELAAARLNSDLAERVLVLQTVLAQARDRTPPPVTLAAGGPLFTPFDGGIRILDLSAPPTVGSATLPGLRVTDTTVLAAAVAHPGQPSVMLTTAQDGSFVALIALTDPAANWAALGDVSARALNLPALLGQLSGAGRRTAAFLVDANGRVIFHSDPAQVGQDLRDHVGIAEAIAGQAGATFARPAGADEHVFGYAPVPLAGWGLVIEEPWRDVIVPMLQYTLLAPLIVLVTAVASLVALYFGLRRVIRPLHVLGRQARRLAWGDFEAILTPAGGIGEIEDLQRILQEMAAQIGRYQAGMHDYIAMLTQTQEEERRHLARELHDETVQGLIALSQRVTMLEYDVAACAGGQSAEAVPHIQKRLADLSALLKQSLQDVRHLIRDLRPVYLEELGLVAALEMLAATIRRDGFSGGFVVMGDERRLTREAELAVYRIAQAATSNATRHAHPTRVNLRLHFNAVGVTLEAEDDGAGFVPPEFPSDLAAQGHYGLVGMHERATRLDGHLSIRSSPGHGTKVVAFLPYDLAFQSVSTTPLVDPGADRMPKPPHNT
jgi:signal transduction histidine kinase